MTTLPQAERATPLTRAEQQLLAEIAGDQPVLYLLETGTKVDVGKWFGAGRVWVGVLAERLALFAGGPRPYREEIPLADLDKSLYNFLTGELALAPASAATVRRVKVAPLDAHKILTHINQKEHSHA